MYIIVIMTPFIHLRAFFDQHLTSNNKKKPFFASKSWKLPRTRTANVHKLELVHVTAGPLDCWSTWLLVHVTADTCDCWSTCLLLKAYIYIHTHTHTHISPSPWLLIEVALHMTANQYIWTCYAYTIPSLPKHKYWYFLDTATYKIKEGQKTASNGFWSLLLQMVENKKTDRQLFCKCEYSDLQNNGQLNSGFQRYQC